MARHTKTSANHPKHTAHDKHTPEPKAPSAAETHIANLQSAMDRALGLIASGNLDGARDEIQSALNAVRHDAVS